MLINLKHIEAYVNENAPKLPYHNAAHAKEAASYAVEIGIKEKCSFEGIQMLHAATLFHDIVYQLNAPHGVNERQSAIIAEQYIRAWGTNHISQAITRRTIHTVKRLILATTWPYTNPPADILEQVIRDADLGNIGTDSYEAKNMAIRMEMNAARALMTPPLPPFTDEEWNRGMVGFLTSVKYNTLTAQKMFNATKNKHTTRITHALKITP